MNEHRRSPFGNALRQLREAAALSQEELAERSGLSVRGVSDLERGARTTPRLETVRMLADGLGLNETQRAELLRARGASRSGETSGRVHAMQKVPIPITSFIGRSRDSEAIVALLHYEHVRLLTLTGPGGVGKTRIAIEVAHKLEDRFTHGAVFVDLAPVQRADLVIAAIAARLGIPGQGRADLRQVLQVWLQDRSLLLVLDNLEQVIDAALDIAWLLESCPGVSILATSRVLLHISAEHVMPIEPMSLPLKSDLASLAESEAASLFVARARAADSGFSLDDENASHVAEVVTRLQGMPLAIELAAARVRFLSLAGLLQQLTSQLPVLTGGGRDVPQRQRTIRNTIAWSYKLLSPTDKTVFRTLSIFPDGCTHATATALLAVDGRFTEEQTLAAVESLVDCSMLRRRAGSDGCIRFRMLQTVQEFGMEQLVAAGEESWARHAAHTAWSAPLAFESEFAIATPGIALWLNRIAAETQNLRTQAAWLLEHGEAEDALDVAIAIATCNGIRGHFDDSRQELEGMLSHPRLQGGTIARMRGVIVLGNLYNHQGDAARAAEFLDQGTRLAEELHQPRYGVVALIDRGIAAFMAGELDSAEAFFWQGTETAQGIGDTFGEATGYRMLAGIAELRGRLGQSQQLLKRSLEMCLSEGYIWGTALAKINLAFQGVLMDNLTEAEQLALDARAHFDELGSPREIPLVLYTLADIARQRDDLERARQLLDEAIDMARDLGTLRALTPILLRRARVALLDGHLDAARAFSLDAVDWFEWCGDVGEAVNGLGLVADIAMACDDARQAAWCTGAMDRLSATHDVPRMSVKQAARQLNPESVAPSLGDREWRNEYGRALVMSDKEILDEVRTWLSANNPLPNEY